jgi:hypothetical protein
VARVGGTEGRHSILVRFTTLNRTCEVFQNTRNIARPIINLSQDYSAKLGGWM